ncbi:hypothetical protein KP509_1Z233700 [Ceratopteris richardii]|nr:hypothetical protein KP509_1Z233700 [Ceratopteris richardii]
MGFIIYGFITDLPKSDKYDAILVILDRFIKMAQFIPTTKVITGVATARIFLRYIFRSHGLPHDIVSDREIHKAQQQYKYYGDQHRVQNPSYQIGDKALCKVRSSNCPFIILAKINPVTFKLQLPSTMRIHPVFHVSMLEPYHISPLRGERPSPSPPIETDDHEEFEVEHVLDSRISRGRLEYLIHWKGYDISDRNWEPVENLQRAPIKVREFHKKIQ